VRLRLSFRPVTLQNQRFITEIWSSAGPKLTIASSSHKSLFEQERYDDAYARFIRELHRRIAAAGGQPSCQTGVTPILYWLGIGVFAATSLALAALTARALQVGEWAGAAFVGGFSALFFWRVGTYFRRNRPGRYRPEGLPPALLPRAGAQPRTTSTEQGA
jgi:hypothetical protein